MPSLRFVFNFFRSEAISFLACLSSPFREERCDVVEYGDVQLHVLQLQLSEKILVECCHPVFLLERSSDLVASLSDTGLLGEVQLVRKLSL